ncbi:alpha/beta hydrolase [Actinoalloteichus sp. AHMU CJ021]|uniref:Pimeloyl-ACP methyl ester carboxylesterase n=1 Tax=Actinoalloteichus caeruleus DSM 43889 TaxID=1120930 RepID=A0ABT1JJB4_ACTCY|nr:alpha/beta fold hydrolase [Actinoalloteichus caeruleus]AUS78211.1 alpha/beta hydrolase [Actinoalloteichus sp. AHMU CJ021]MCP2332251.1 Pimeloyl-ACP methyl ester carboxylesterase [Actinoalloteichus caeruleus DSM 43889]
MSPHRAIPVQLPTEYGELSGLHGTSQARTVLATAVLLPGYTGSKEDFAALIDPLTEAGFDVLTIDLPGQYQSDGPDDEDAYRPSRLGVVIANLVSRLRSEGRRVLLLGHSYGGLVARAAVLSGAEPVGLTLLASGPSALPPGPRLSLIELCEPALRLHGVEAAAQIYEAHDPAWSARPRELRTLLRARLVSSMPAGLLGMATALRTEPDLVPELAARIQEHRIRGFVVCGEQDDVWSVETQREMAEKLGVDFVTVPDSGHNPNKDNPQGLLDVLVPTWQRWLLS